MVLEEATATPDSFSSDSAPSSDADPYYGDRNPTELATRDPSYVSVNSGSDTVHVNLNSLPRPWGFLGSPPHAPQLSDAIRQSCSQAQKVMGRPVTQEEADALAFHFAKSVRIGSYGAPVGMAVASAIAYRGMSKYKFPGYTPGEKFNPDKFPMLKGARARLMWQITRFNVYWFLGAAVGQIFFGSYALTVGTAGRAMDPRLKTMMEALQQQAKSGGLPGNRQVDQTAGKREGETFDMARQRQRAQEAWRNSKAQAQQQSSTTAKADSGDDMSPTGGAFGAEFVDLGSAAVSDTAMMSDDQARRQSEGIQRQQEESYAKSRDPQQSQQAVSQRRQEPSRDAFSSEEDSRPTQSGSAWERLRQQASSGKPPAPASTSRSAVSREVASSGDSFTFSSKDEDKQLAKAEAQKDFDSRLERERSGKDFEDKRRW
ncbi:hypothetical protein Slin15195_G101750 [Septoria linicola]|uniref:Uncharacterized protein n=1 Tax=Septoria linicola TaxID=215465 RepID=A0A9Q9B443_9PEZI|nr:hypothetical protein Slin14017_G064760 [Septoria linicola]USW56856.1 hypothetical protein Slin15195_G101750 [Septoria linicola]